MPETHAAAWRSGTRPGAHSAPPSAAAPARARASLPAAGAEAAPRPGCPAVLIRAWRRFRRDMREDQVHQHQDVRVVGGVDLVTALPAGRDQASQAQLAQLLAHRRDADAGLPGQPAHVVLAMTQQPHQVQPQRRGQHVEHASPRRQLRRCGRAASQGIAPSACHSLLLGAPAAAARSRPPAIGQMHVAAPRSPAPGQPTVIQSAT